MTAIIIIFVIIVIFVSSLSNLPTRKGRLIDGLGKIANTAGEFVSGVGDSLKESSIESEFNKIDLNSDFHLIYRENGKCLSIYSNLKYTPFGVADITDELKTKLINDGVANDNNLIRNIENNQVFYQTCKKLGVKSVTISGCDIYPDNSIVRIKESRLLKVLKVGEYRFENK